MNQVISNTDLFYSLVTGLTAGVIAWRIFVFLEKRRIFSAPVWVLVFAIPITWIFGVWLGIFLGQYLGFFTEFGKFAVIGLTNAAVDFGILNLLIYLTDVARGRKFTIFKSASFIVATMHSYFWNKYWAFNAGGSGGGGFEFLQFFVVAIFAMVVNVSVASVVVNQVGPKFGIGEKAWASVGAIAGSAAALILSFIGFRLIVFK